MKQTIKGWTVGLIGSNGCRFFLGRYRNHYGKWDAQTYRNPCDYYVCTNLFPTSEEALDFWETCNYEIYGGKGQFKAVPVQIELSVEVKGLGFDWNGIK